MPKIWALAAKGFDRSEQTREQSLARQPLRSKAGIMASDLYIVCAARDEAAAILFGEALRERGFAVEGVWHTPFGPERDRAHAAALEAARLVLLIWSEAGAGSPRVLNAAMIAAREGRAIDIRFDHDLPMATLARLRASRKPAPARLLCDLAAGGAPAFHALIDAIEDRLAAPDKRPFVPAPRPHGRARSRLAPRILAFAGASFALAAGALAAAQGPLGAEAHTGLYRTLLADSVLRGLLPNETAPAAPPPQWDRDLAGLPIDLARTLTLARAAAKAADEAARMAESAANAAERLAREPKCPQLQKSDAIWRGTVKGGAPAGLGRRSFPDGARYWGHEAGTGREGEGVVLFANRESFHGSFRNDRANGYGRYRFQSGAHYDGQWADGAMSGYGVLYFPDGGRFEGQFAERNGQPVYQGLGAYWPAGGQSPLWRDWRQAAAAPSAPDPDPEAEPDKPDEAGQADAPPRPSED